MSLGARYDAEELKRRLSFAALLEHEGVELRRTGGNLVALCPFHGERTPSFTVHGNRPDRGHCYGCGWDGDVIDFWRARRGGGYLEALAALASLVALAPGFSRNKIDPSQVPVMTKVAGRGLGKPALPRMRALDEGQVAALAALRGLGKVGVRAAARDKRVGGCEWPQFQDYKDAWRMYPDAAPCWVVTDSARRVAQFRRLDGVPFRREDGGEFKAWTKGSSRWPVGAVEIGDRAGVLLVEGGADMLAAYHFLSVFGRLEHVAVVAMLGTARIADEALGYFRRKRVRIMMDEDEPKHVPGRAEPLYPGREAAARWTEQLAGVGAAVETFSLGGLTTEDGGRVKDLNDLAHVQGAAWADGELVEAFVDFDF